MDQTLHSSQVLERETSVLVFDNVIMGSSPVCLLEAIHSTQSGKRTCIIDDAEFAGGAWKSLPPDDSGIGNIELGCHIFEKDKNVYGFLHEKLGLELAEMNPQPKLIYGKKRIPYNFKNFILFFRHLSSYFKRKHGLPNLKVNLRRFTGEFFQLRLKYFSFSGGSTILTKKLSGFVKRNNIATQFSTRVIQVHVNTQKNYVELVTKSNEKIKTNKFTLSASSDFSSFTIDGKEMSGLMQKKTVEYVHMHLLVKDPRLKPLSYLRVYNNRMIHRISNMSDQMKLNPDEHLLCIGIYSDQTKTLTVEQLTKKIMTELIRLRVLSSESLLISKRINTYLHKSSNYNDLKKLEDYSNGLIRMLFTPDIVLGIKDNLNRYNSVNYNV